MQIENRTKRIDKASKACSIFSSMSGLVFLSHLHTSTSPSPLLFLVPNTHSPACHCGRFRLPTRLLPLHSHADFSPSRPNLSLWQVPPSLILASPTFLSFLLFSAAALVRLVIVAGPAPLPLFFSTTHTISTHPPTQTRPNLSLWQVPPHSSSQLTILHFLLLLPV